MYVYDCAQTNVIMQQQYLARDHFAYQATLQFVREFRINMVKQTCTYTPSQSCRLIAVLEVLQSTLYLANQLECHLGVESCVMVLFEHLIFVWQQRQ